MKKIFLILLLFVPSSVFALSLDCPDKVSFGEEFICQFKANEITGIKANLELAEGIDYQKIEVIEPWKIYYSSLNGFVLGNISNIALLEAKLVFKASDKLENGREYSISLNKIEASDLGVKNTSRESIFSKVKVISDNNYLSTLGVKNEKFTPSFQKDISTYFVETENSQVEIQATSQDRLAKVEGDIGKQSLVYGVNKFIIKVISARNHERDYTIYVTRKVRNVLKNEDASLKKLVINQKDISLKKNQYYYKVTLDNQEENLVVKAIPLYDTTKVDVLGESQLKVGSNEVRIVTTSESGIKNIYLVNVVRKKKLSHDSKLKSIVIKNYYLPFSSNRYQYQLSIKEESQLDIQLVLNDQASHYKIYRNKNLKNNSVIKIVVWAEDKSVSTYQIKILKENKNLSVKFFNENSKLLPLIAFALCIILVLGIKIARTYVKRKIGKID
ncbi:MAG: hypothetical protein PUD25_06665 [Bacilli bacterium]|nr:hypothetical protein [Bacilli bacterium]